MSLLDTIVNNFFRDQGFTQFIDKPEPVRLAEQSEQRQTKPGLVDIFKQDPNTGQQVRLQRPSSQPFAVNEMLGLQRPQRSFTDFLGDTADKGFNILKSLGQITGFGSEYWKPGLDIDLQTGDQVPTPVSGTVEFVGSRGGFGNQVRVRGNDGRSYWLSHLQAPNVQVGQQVRAGQPIGIGGKSGNVIPGPGGDGSHLDLTVQDQSGKLLSAVQVKNLLDTFG